MSIDEYKIAVLMLQPLAVANYQIITVDKTNVIICIKEHNVLYYLDIDMQLDQPQEYKNSESEAWKEAYRVLYLI